MTYASFYSNYPQLWKTNSTSSIFTIYGIDITMKIVDKVEEHLANIERKIDTMQTEYPEYLI